MAQPAKALPSPLLERLGSGYLRAGKEAAATADDPIHVLNPVERAALLRVVRGAISRAALAGALNAVATGFWRNLRAAAPGPHARPRHAAAAGQVLGRVRGRGDRVRDHLAMLRAVRARVGDPAAGVELDDSRAFLKALPTLSDGERRIAVRVLAAAAILDGRLVRNERRLLTEAYAAAAIEPGLDHVEKLRRAFVAGDVIPRDELRRTA